MNSNMTCGFGTAVSPTTNRGRLIWIGGQRSSISGLALPVLSMEFIYIWVLGFWVTGFVGGSLCEKIDTVRHHIRSSFHVALAPESWTLY